MAAPPLARSRIPLATQAKFIRKKETISLIFRKKYRSLPLKWYYDQIFTP